jgi:hypothetical protein
VVLGHTARTGVDTFLSDLTKGKQLMLKIMGAPLAVVVVASASALTMSGCMGWHGGGSPATSEPQSPPGVGRDSGMEFTVMDLTTASTLGNGVMSATAKGIYVVVSMKVKNLSANATGSVGHLNSDVLIDGTGRQYDSDYGAATNLEDSSSGTLQPGSWAPLKEAFDVPLGTSPSAIVMHADMGTPGVQISLAPLNPSPARDCAMKFIDEDNPSHPLCDDSPDQGLTFDQAWAKYCDGETKNHECIRKPGS